MNLMDLDMYYDDIREEEWRNENLYDDVNYPRGLRAKTLYRNRKELMDRIENMMEVDEDEDFYC